MLNKSVVSRQLKKYIQVCSNNEEYQRRILAIERVIKSEEWKYVVQILWAIKNEMAIELLESSKFTALPPDEKDKTQTVYANINEWINFLTNPMAWIRKKGMIQMFTTNLFKGDSQTHQ